MSRKLIIVLLLGLFILPTSVQAFSFPKPSFFSFPSFPGASSTPKPSFTPNPSGPDLQALEPTTVNYSQTFTLKGKNFGTTGGSVQFFVRGNSIPSASAPVVSWSDNEIKATVPAVQGNSYYDIAVKKSDNSLTNMIRIRVKYGQPLIETTSIVNQNGEVTITLSGRDFNSKDGKIVFYNSANTVVGEGDIDSWSNSRIRFTPPTLSAGDYKYQIQTSDGRLSVFKNISF
jgi:hypothetical protein